MINIKKKSAVKLRKLGKSYREIGAELGIARSTLSGWLKDVQLTEKQKIKLYQKWLSGTAKGRERGSLANHQKKVKKNLLINKEVNIFMSDIIMDNKQLEVFMSGLYLGDGFKIGGRVGLGNSNPNIVLLFLNLLRELYKIDSSKLRAQIFGRVDQNEAELINYWSKLLEIPPNQFHKTQFDKRTVNGVTRASYRGVCAVVLADTALQRRILAIGEEMIKYVNRMHKRTRSSDG